MVKGMDARTIPLTAAYRGRRWFAAYLIVITLALLPLSVMTLFLDTPWLAFLVMGVPCLFSAGFCLATAFGEMVARIELREDGFSIRLPSYRGWLPFWPVQSLDAEWDSVTEIRSHTAHGRMLFVPFEYILHRIETQNGAIVLLEPLPGFFRNVRGMSFGLPMHDILSFVAAKAVHAPHSRTRQ
jgi:hypothetical protein